MRYAVAFVVLLAACGGGDGDIKLRTVEVVGGQQRYAVDFIDQGGGVRHIVVNSLGYRSIDRSEGALAYRIASQAADTIQCANGRGVNVLPETAIFQESDRSQGALSRGGAIWQFKGRCGA
ncbi:MAG: hypothetical protein AAF415_20425 [Pseudomonadota bacterium]